MSEQLFRATTASGESLIVAKGVAAGRNQHYVPIGCMNVSYPASELSDLRPVRIVEEGSVVLDIAEIEKNCTQNTVASFLYGLVNLNSTSWMVEHALAYIAEQISRKPEGPSKPKRMEEPTEYGWVESGIWEVGGWSRYRFYGPFPRTDNKKWVCESNLEFYIWDELAAPVLVRDGVE